MRRSLIVMALLFLPVSGMAAQKPTELSGVIRAKNPVGVAQLQKLFMDVYAIEFWSDSGNWKRPPYALSITYNMNFSTEELVERTYDEMRHVSELPDEQLRAHTEQLRMIYPSVREGDRVTALRKKTGTYFYHNGKRIGNIRGSAFADAFFGIWLSPKSSEPEMLQQLLSSPT